MKYEHQILVTARWTARVVGTLILLIAAALAIGEGVHPARMFESLRVGLLTAAMLTMMVGQFVAWEWEGVGGLFVLGAFVLFAVVNHGVPLNVVFGPWLLTGLLYLGCGWMKGKALAGLSCSP